MMKGNLLSFNVLERLRQRLLVVTSCEFHLLKLLVYSALAWYSLSLMCSFTILSSRNPNYNYQEVNLAFHLLFFSFVQNFSVT